MGVDTRKPKHSLDTNRPSKGMGNQRDAATVRGGGIPRSDAWGGLPPGCIMSCCLLPALPPRVPPSFLAVLLKTCTCSP